MSGMTTNEPSEPVPPTERPPTPADLAWIAAITAAKGTVIALAVDAFLNSNSPRYHGKGMRLRAIGYTGGLLIAPVAWRLRGANPGNSRTIRHLARAEREILRALEAARAPLDALKSSHAALGEIIPLIDESSKEIDGARAALAAAAGGADATPIEGAAESARSAAGRLDGAVEALEQIRSTSLAEARAARAWLRSEMGGLADRIARVAGMARDQAARARDASGEAGAPDSAARVLDLLADLEGIRGATESLQDAARPEGDRQRMDGDVRAEAAREAGDPDRAGAHGRRPSACILA